MMKKFFMFVAFAAMCITASAQDLKTYDGPHSISQYPADFEPVVFSWSDEDGVVIWKKDDQHSLEIIIQEDFSTVDDLASNGEYMKGEKEVDINDNPSGWKTGDVVVKGKIMYFRAVKDGICSYGFLVNFKDDDCFKGEMIFPESEETKYKPMLEKILSTLKKK